MILGSDQIFSDISRLLEDDGRTLDYLSQAARGEKTFLCQIGFGIESVWNVDLYIS